MLVNGLTVFAFHEVTDSPSPLQQQSRTFVKPDLFADQIEWLRRRFTLIKPTDLKQLGGYRNLPHNAGMITFDDAWAGVFRIALPLLESMRIPSVCFLNMATVMGDPDLSAVRHFEELAMLATRESLPGGIDTDASESILARIRARYGTNSEFRRFQGPTATPDDLRKVSHDSEMTWLGSHLYHHWDLRHITCELYEQSLRDNLDALARYANSLPMFAVPYGYADEKLVSLPRRLGYRVVMSGTGSQNVNPESFVLDRLELPAWRSTSREWWYAAHRCRVLGWRRSRTRALPSAR